MFEELKDYKVNFDAQKEAYKDINKKIRELLDKDETYLIVNPEGLKINDEYYRQYKGKIDKYVKPTENWIEYDEALGYDFIIVNSAYAERTTTVSSYTYTSGYQVTVDTSTGNVTDVSDINSTGSSISYDYKAVPIHTGFWIKKINPKRKKETLEKETEYLKYWQMIKDIKFYGKHANVNKVSRFAAFIYNFSTLLMFAAMFLSAILCSGILLDKLNGGFMYEVFTDMGLCDAVVGAVKYFIPACAVAVLGLAVNIIFNKYFARFNKTSLKLNYSCFAIYFCFIAIGVVEEIFTFKYTLYGILEFPFVLMHLTFIVQVIIHLFQMIFNFNFRFINQQIGYRQFLLTDDNYDKINRISAWLKKTKLDLGLPSIINL